MEATYVSQENFTILNPYNKGISYLKEYTKELMENETEELCEGGLDFFMDDNEFKSSGWKYWAGLVINNITNLDKEIKIIKDDLKSNTDNLYKEIKADKENVNTIMVSLEELKRIGDKLENLSDDIKEIKTSYTQINTDVTGLKIKSSIWGALSGAISAGVATLLYILVKK